MWTNVARPDVAWTNVALTNVASTNGTGPLVNSQGWFHKLEMSSRYFPWGWMGGGWGKIETNAISVQLYWSMEKMKNGLKRG